MVSDFSFELTSFNKKQQIKKSNIIIHINELTFSNYINDKIFNKIRENINKSNFNKSLLDLFKYYEYFISFENRIILEKKKKQYFNINILYSDKESILYKINTLLYYRFIDLSNHTNIIKDAKHYIYCIQYINSKLIEINTIDSNRLLLKSKDFILKIIYNKLWKYYSIKNYINNFTFQKKKKKIKKVTFLKKFSKKLTKLYFIKLPNKQLEFLEKLFNDISYQKSDTFNLLENLTAIIACSKIKNPFNYISYWDNFYFDENSNCGKEAFIATTFLGSLTYIINL